jgi:malonyl-CoA O-methyltransferase
VNEGIHLYCLWPIRRAGELLNERRYTEFARKSASYYLKHADLTNFERPNALGHFFAYIQEALAELGHTDVARRGLASIARYQQRDGSVPGYYDVPWVCSTALAQLAKAWYATGETDRADRALAFMTRLQNASGGFFGSYGVRADYFPSQEIAWAVKYFVDAQQIRIARHFDGTVSQYSSDIGAEDARVLALVAEVGDLNGRKVLDAGCGKGRYSALLKRLYPQADITAMDISAEMLKHVPAGISTVQNGILNMPFDSGAFDVVLCVEALEHVVQIDAGIRELARVVAPGGQVVVIDKNKDRLGALDMPDWEKWFRRDELVRAMRDCDLEATAVEIPGDRRACPQGLFLLWAGRRARLAAEVVPDSEARVEACAR